MKLTKTVWASAVAAALALTTLSAHADKKEQVQKILTLQQAGLDDLAVLDSGLVEGLGRGAVGLTALVEFVKIVEDEGGLEVTITVG